MNKDTAPMPSNTYNSSHLSQRAQRSGGHPINELMGQALAHPELISLAAGFVDDATLPVEPTREALARVMGVAHRARAALQYGTTPGYPPLRESLAERMSSADRALGLDTPIDPHNVVITAGSNQLLHLVAETLLDPGDIVLTTAPTYFVFLGTLANLGARTVAVATDEHGMIPDALEATLRRLDHEDQLDRVKAFYLTSYFDNPCSVSLALDRRPQIVEIARRWSRQGRIRVIEDTAYRELRYGGDDLPSLRTFDEDGQTVIVAGTFSKSYSPGIRVGWGVLPSDLTRVICDQKGNVDFGSPNFAQHLMHAVMEDGGYDDHLDRVRDTYRAKLQAMLDAAQVYLAPLAGVDWIRPRGGLYVWVTLPEQIDASPNSRLFQRALEAGVLYVAGEYCFANEGVAVRKNALRLSFGVQPPANISQGVQALGDALREVLA